MENNNPNSDNIKNALCYIPVFAIILHFTEWNKSKVLEKHIRYWISLFVLYVILSILIAWLFTGFIFLSYIGASIFLWYKAYIWEDVEISIIDNFFKSK